MNRNSNWRTIKFQLNMLMFVFNCCFVSLFPAQVLTYVAEVTEPKYRGMLTVTGTTSVIVGVFVQFILGSLFPWRTIALVSSVIPIVTILILFFVPESPYWLINKSRILDAQKSLAWLRGWVKPELVNDEFIEIQTTVLKKKRQNDGTKKSSFVQRLAPYSKRTFLMPFSVICTLVFVGCFSGKTTLQTYAVEVNSFIPFAN